MELKFSKYQGAGNDFVIINDLNLENEGLNAQTVKLMCDRHFGIGADGLMLLRSCENYDFEMVYFNSDGRPSSMCGNGGRCLVDFAKSLGIISSKASFLAVDGPHLAEWIEPGLVKLQMASVQELDVIAEGMLFLDTGSPHVVKRIDGLRDLDIIKQAQLIRYSERFSSEGVNVNFVEWLNNEIHIRTYERGVENETLACGTGVTAAAIAFHYWGLIKNSAHIHAIGGELDVQFEFENGSYTNVWKSGPVKQVFDGHYVL